MDRFTRNYLLGLGALVLLGAVWWVASLDYRAGSLSAMLQDDPVVGAYPYAFRVRAVSNGVAEMYTPRSAELPAVRFIGMLYPDLAGLPPDHPEMVGAQQELARVQERARELVLAQSDIDQVRWLPDRGWYEKRGVAVP